jgi:hypothetical protein
MVRVRGKLIMFWTGYKYGWMDGWIHFLPKEACHKINLF